MLPKLADNLEKGLFTSEVEATVVEGTTDLAVHSQKDMPSEFHPACAPPIVFERAAVEDLLLVRKDRVGLDALLPLHSGAQVATSSARREALLAHYRPDLKVLPIRGNVPTRLEKVRQGFADALVLARAGLQRLNLELDDFAVFRLEPTLWLPAPGQGAIALQVRSDRPDLLELLADLSTPEVAEAVRLERQMLELSGGGCHVALGAYAERTAQGLWRLRVGRSDDRQWCSSERTGPALGLPEAAHDQLLTAEHKAPASPVFSRLKSVR